MIADQPWAHLHADAHAKHWGQAADYVNNYLKEWELALAEDHGG